MSVSRDLWRVRTSPVRPKGVSRLAGLLLAGAALASAAGLALAQGMSEQEMRCLQLQQELAAAQGGGGANREELGRIEQQIAQADRVFQGTRAAMEDAGCFDSFFIFGRGLVRSPKCLKMNDRVEGARRDLAQLQQQRQALTGGGNRRRQAELHAALARSGCGGVRAPQPRRGGGLFDFFSGGREEEEALPQTPIYRSIDPNGRYRSVCVRLCDGFYFPVSYATYGAHLAQDAAQCQANCAAPAELYVYRNPGQDIEQAVSLTGSAYMDLPVALRYRKEYVKGCSCKQAEYNPTQIEAANKRAEAEASGQPLPPEPEDTQAAAPQAAGAPQQLELEITGSSDPAPAAPPEAAPASLPASQQPAAAPEVQASTPPTAESAPRPAINASTPPPAAEAAPAPQPPAPTAEAEPALPAPQPTAEPASSPTSPPPAQAANPPAPAASAQAPAQSTVVKRKPAPSAPASPFAPQF